MEVWVRSSGNTADVAETTRALAYVITAPTGSPVVTNVALTANLAAPQVAGTAVTFTATPTEGVAPHQYKWMVFDGVSWTSVMGWTTVNTYAWTPAVASANFRIGVWARSAGNTADAAEYPVSVGFAITP
jgi:hypothetical protein